MVVRIRFKGYQKTGFTNMKGEGIMNYKFLFFIVGAGVMMFSILVQGCAVSKFSNARSVSENRGLIYCSGHLPSCRFVLSSHIVPG